MRRLLARLARRWPPDPVEVHVFIGDDGELLAVVVDALAVIRMHAPDDDGGPPW